jgi:hypothetical protein
MLHRLVARLYERVTHKPYWTTVQWRPVAAQPPATADATQTARP